MRKTSLLSGVCTALPTPLADNARPDAGSVDPLLDSLLASGVTGFCVGGPTGEYALYDAESSLRLFRCVAHC